jgi:DNA polymerase III epsilon subunit-like protein
MKYSFVIDIESTGFCPIRNDIISIGLVVLDDKLQVIDTFYEKAKPDVYKWMTEDTVATHVHGFTLSEMLFFPDRMVTIKKLMIFLVKYLCSSHTPRPLFYHAIKGFDYLFLDWFFRKENLEYSLYKIFTFPTSHSTVLLARSLGYEANKLDQWASRLGESFNHHNALDDAMMCAKLLQYTLKNHFNNDVELLFEQLRKVKENDLQKVQKKEESSGFFNL